MRRFFDCHTHLFPDRRMGGLMRWIHRSVPDFDVPIDITAQQAIDDLRASGAVRWANLLFPIAPGEAAELHAHGAALAERTPEITPFGGVHVDDDDPLGVVQEAVERHGMAGLKFHPMVQGFEPWDDRLEPAIAYVEERELPVYVHTGYDEWYGVEIDWTGLDRMLLRHPRLPVVLPHIGFPDLAWAFDVADRHPGVWLDLTNVPGSFGWFGIEDEHLVRTLVAGVDAHIDRVLMGTDYPAGMGSLPRILRQFDRIGFTEAQLEAIMVTSTRAFFDRYGRPRP